VSEDWTPESKMGKRERRLRTGFGVSSMGSDSDTGSGLVVIFGL